MLFEDDHLLVVHKPAGWNTHSPSPYAGEGIYEWLRHREPRWATLAIIHRLDKETSGVMVFGRTPLANRSLTDQFARHLARKRYILLTDRAASSGEFAVNSPLVRVGDRYVARPGHPGAEPAITRFTVLSSSAGRTELAAHPLTGRTHQIRVHAAERGLPILGDLLYGGTSAPRLCLHSESLTLTHPASREEMTFRAPANFAADPRAAFRNAFIEPERTDAFRLIHGASDGWPGWYVDRLGDYLLSQSDTGPTADQRNYLESIPAVTGIYHKRLERHVRGIAPVDVSPQLVIGQAAPERFSVLENRLRFELSFTEGYSVGLFLDQRDNRRRFLIQHVAADFPLFPSGPAGVEVLNTFAYTCGFSVCAAKAGARVTSLDLSKKYLEWGRRNFLLNDLDPTQHDFIYGEAFGWLKRLAKKQRRFDAVILDPPTFSQSKERGTFRIEKDFGRLVGLAVPLIKPGGVLFASTNAASMRAEAFVNTVESVVTGTGRAIRQRHYAPQPPDFPVTRAEPAYLKTIWVRC